MSTLLTEKIDVPKQSKKKRDQLIDLWASLPLVLRYFALATLGFTILAVIVGYWQARGTRPVLIKAGQPQLSQEIEAIVNGYERRVTVNDKLQMFVKADREIKFTDGRHELENVFLEVHPENSDAPDRVRANKAVYTPDGDGANPENYTINFLGKVHFETRDQLQVETEQITYDKQTETATTGSAVHFSRQNITGSSVGAVFKVKEKQLVLQNQVDINVAPSEAAIKNSITDFGKSAVKINSARATVNHDLGHFELDENVQIVVTPLDKNKSPTTIRSRKAVYEQQVERLDLTGSVEIVVESDNAKSEASVVANNLPKPPVYIRAQTAVYEQNDNRVNLSGEPSIEQNSELIKGNFMTADLNEKKRIQKGVVRENSFLRTVEHARATEVNSAEMSFLFDDNQQLKNAVASGNVRVQSLSGDQTIDLVDPSLLTLDFLILKNQSLLSKMTTEGMTNARISANNSIDYSQIAVHAPVATETLFAVQNSTLR